ncbi:MAG: iron permease [Dethiosulfovibrio peptidovorans]|nr:MAG: iron permease [Dethiosulfovibrio peptidovorans]
MTLSAKSRLYLGFISMMALIFVALSVRDALAAKKKYDTWREVAADMSLEFNAARHDIENDKYRDAYKHMNKAYFGFYEVQGFEKNVMVVISSARVGHIEALFASIKHALLGNTEMPKATILNSLEALRVKVYKDAMVLDGVVNADDPDSLGEAVYGDVGKPALAGASSKKEAEAYTSEPQAESASEEKPRSPSGVAPGRGWFSFLTAFGLLVREGLEAILVIVAIVAYLIKTGNGRMVRSVYYGSIAAIGASVVLAVVLEFFMGEASGVARELLEGWTMFLAVAVLFYVSNWMLSKSETEAWTEYISDKVQQSIDRRSQMTLVFAAFIAVMREGAELILFYKAAFSGGMSSTPHIVYGILAGVIVLIAVYVAFRYFSVKLPLKPFFLFTSILLFVLCVSFMGKGVVELTEADVIMGSTVIPSMHGFSIEFLNIYDRAETLIPQVMLIIAAVWIILSHSLGNSKKAKQ